MDFAILSMNETDRQIYPSLFMQAIDPTIAQLQRYTIKRICQFIELIEVPCFKAHNGLFPVKPACSDLYNKAIYIACRFHGGEARDAIFEMQNFNLHYSCVKFWVDARRRKPTT